MNWFRVQTPLPTHPKVHALADELKVPWQHALGMLTAVLAWAASRDQEDIVVTQAQAKALAVVSGHVGPPQVFTDALVATGWLDALEPGNYRLHDWREWNGSAVRESLAARDRMRRLRSPNVRQTFEERSPPTQHNTTQTLHNTTKKKRRAAQQTDNVVALAPAAPGPAALVAAWGEVYAGKEGRPYRHQRADFVQAAPLAAQGVTPEEVRAAAERAWRPGLNPWLAVRSFKAFATRFAEIAVAKSSQAQHNVASREELELQEQRLGEVPL